MAALLAWSAALNLATGALLIYAGFRVARRQASGEARLALRMFATWWFAVAAVILISGSPTLLYLAGVTSLSIHVALVYAVAAPLAVALWALLYYLVYIYTGRRWAIWPLGGAYALFFLFELYYFSAFGERRLDVTDWSVRTVGGAFPPTWLSLTFAVLLAVPILVVIVAYGRLYFRVKDRPHRYRVALISSAFLAWFGAVLVGYLLGWDRAEWFPLVYEAPGVIASLLVVAAFRPPRWVQRRITDELPEA